MRTLLREDLSNFDWHLSISCTSLHSYLRPFLPLALLGFLCAPFALAILVLLGLNGMFSGFRDLLAPFLLIFPRTLKPFLLFLQHKDCRR